MISKIVVLLMRRCYMFDVREAIGTTLHCYMVAISMTSLTGLLKVEQQMIICNAYASPASMDVYHVRALVHFAASLCREHNEMHHI